MFRRRQNSIKFQGTLHNAKAWCRTRGWRSGFGLSGGHNGARLLWVSTRFESVIAPIPITVAAAKVRKHFGDCILIPPFEIEVPGRIALDLTDGYLKVLRHLPASDGLWRSDGAE